MFSAGSFVSDLPKQVERELCDWHFNNLQHIRDALIITFYAFVVFVFINRTITCTASAAKQTSYKCITFRIKKNLIRNGKRLLCTCINWEWALLYSQFGPSEGSGLLGSTEPKSRSLSKFVGYKCFEMGLKYLLIVNIGNISEYNGECYCRRSGDWWMPINRVF